MNREDEIADAVAKMGADHADEIVAGLQTILDNVSKKGMVPQDALGMSEGKVEQLYAQAYQQYNSGQYVEASRLFRVLMMLNATEPKYTFGLASCFHMLKEYQHAAQLYLNCSVLDPENPVPYYHASDCYVQMQDPLSAIVALEMAMEKTEGKAQYAVIKDRAKLSIESLRKELQAT